MRLTDLLTLMPSLTLVAPSGECLWGEGLVSLIGAVVCSLAAYRGSNCLLARAMDGRI